MPKANLDQMESKALEASRAFGFEPLSVSLLGGQSYLVKAANKNGAQIELVLKHFAEPSRQQNFQDRLALELSESGFKLIPQSFFDADKRTLHFSAGRYWSCSQYLHCGRQYDFLDFDCSSNHAFLAGQTLAFLHSRGRKLLDKRGKFLAGPDQKSFFAAFPRCFSALIGSLEKIPAHKCGPEAPGLLNNLDNLDFVLLEKQAAKISLELIKIEERSKQTIVHGDFHPGNLLFDDKSVLALIDWEYAAIGSGLFDLCYGLFFFTLQPQFLNEKSADLFSPQKTEAFLEAYSRAGLSVKSSAELNLYSEFVHLLLLDWALRECLAEDSPYVVLPGFEELCACLHALAKSIC